MNAIQRVRVPVHQSGGTDGPPTGPRDQYIPAWLWNLPLDYAHTTVVMTALATAWWRGLRVGVLVGITVAACAWWAL